MQVVHYQTAFEHTPTYVQFLCVEQRKLQFGNFRLMLQHSYTRTHTHTHPLYILATIYCVCFSRKLALVDDNAYYEGKILFVHGNIVREFQIVSHFPALISFPSFDVFQFFSLCKFRSINYINSPIDLHSCWLSVKKNRNLYYSINNL